MNSTRVAADKIDKTDKTDKTNKTDKTDKTDKDDEDDQRWEFSPRMGAKLRAVGVGFLQTSIKLLNCGERQFAQMERSEGASDPSFQIPIARKVLEKCQRRARK